MTGDVLTLAAGAIGISLLVATIWGAWSTWSKPADNGSAHKERDI